MSDHSKIKLDLNEENELSFQIAIEGSDPELGSQRAQVRLVLTDESTGRALLYKCNHSADGMVTVVIESDTNLFSEEHSYHAQLEVIIGSHYFVPTEFEVEFVRPLRVEAVSVSARSLGPSSTRHNKSNEVMESSPIKKAPVPQVAVETIHVKNSKATAPSTLKSQLMVEASVKESNKTSSNAEGRSSTQQNTRVQTKGSS